MKQTILLCKFLTNAFLKYHILYHGCTLSHFLSSKKETGPELVVIYDFDERHLAGILANKADESLKEKLNLVDHLCENTF